MRKCLRIVLLAIAGLLSTAMLGAVTAMMAAVSLAATALIVPGTGTPNANVVVDYREHFVDRYSAPFDPSCTSTNGCTLTGVDYPASFWPLGFIGNWCPGYKCDTWDESVGSGVDGVVTNLQGLTDPDGAILLGYSQGGAVVSDALRELEGNSLLDKITSVVLIGNAYNPDGGIFTRLGFLPTIPFLNVTFGPATPTDLGIPMVGIGFQYDPVMYAPTYWGNALAMLNAFAAFDKVHGLYLTPDGNGPEDPIAYGYTEDELAAILAGPCPGVNCRVDENGNKYYMIPAKNLPLFDFLTSQLPAPLQPLLKPFVDLTAPVTKVLIDLGYDFSGDPGKTRWLSPLPFNPIQNWPAVGVNLVGAALQGVQAFIGDLGAVGSTLAPADTNAPDVTPLTSLAKTASQDDGADDGAAVVAAAAEESDGAVSAQTAPSDATASDAAASATTSRDEARAEREAKREEAKAARDEARAEREAKREEAKAARDAAKAERDAAEAEHDADDGASAGAGEAAA